MRIPEKGLTEDAIFSSLESYRRADVDWRSGKTFGYQYDAGREAERIAKKAYGAFLSENALDPTAYPSLRRLEVELVAIAREHLHGDARVVGNFTSGGTESILLAVKTARDFFRAKRPDLRTPKMLLPITAHAAFHKAAKYFDVEPVLVPIRSDYRADVAAARELFTDDVILVVGSAPQFAHGVIDPIAELAALASERGALMHVDACVGGWLLPYWERLGEPVPPFDFRVPGVTSISMDLHKYAFCAKGASIILHRDADLRRHQIFASAAWAGYSVVNCAVQSSKSGGPMAAAWAVLHHVGDAGYLAHAKAIRDTTRALVAAIRDVDGLYVMGEPEMSLVAFRSDTVDIFHVVDEMRERGWLLGVQPSRPGSEASMHLTVHPGNTAHVGAFAADLRASVAAAKKLPKSALAEQLRGVFASLGPAEVTSDVFAQLVGAAGLAGSELPGRMAEVNEILCTMPPAVVERLLVEYLNRLFSESSLPA